MDNIVTLAVTNGILGPIMCISAIFLGYTLRHRRAPVMQMKHILCFRHKVKEISNGFLLHVLNMNSKWHWQCSHQMK